MAKRGCGGLAITTSNSQQHKVATVNDGSLMLLARNSYGDRRKYIEILIKEINHGNKMFVPASKHSVYTTAHEFGHVVEAYLVRNAKRSELMDKYRLVKSELTKEAMSLSAMTLVRLIGAFHISFPFHTSRVTSKAYWRT